MKDQYSPIFALSRPTKSVPKLYAGAVIDSLSYCWVWGLNTTGNLGIGSIENQTIPVLIDKKNFLSLSLYPGEQAHCAGIDPNSYAWAWGSNSYGKLGINNTYSYWIPISIVGGKQWRTISCGNSHCATIDSNSYAWAWGANGYGQCGDNSSIARSSPISAVGGKQWRNIKIGAYFTIALDSNSYAWGWGIGGYLGDNTLSNRSSPTSVVGGKQWREIAVGESSSYGIDSNSYAWSWGSNSNGDLGDNTTNHRSSPISVIGGRQWIKISSCIGTILALDTNSYAWSWGFNGDGQFGDATTGVQRSSPISVAGGRQWIAIASGNRSNFALDSNSFVWAWGYYNYIPTVNAPYPCNSPVKWSAKDPPTNPFGAR